VRHPGVGVPAWLSSIRPTFEYPEAPSTPIYNEAGTRDSYRPHVLMSTASLPIEGLRQEYWRGKAGGWVQAGPKRGERPEQGEAGLAQVDCRPLARVLTTWHIQSHTATHTVNCWRCTWFLGHQGTGLERCISLFFATQETGAEADDGCVPDAFKFSARLHACLHQRASPSHPRSPSRIH
jgi:hypothetical protein